MDVRLVLLIAVVAIVAGLRWRRRAPTERAPQDATRAQPVRPERPAAQTHQPAVDGDEHLDVELEEALDRVWHEHSRGADLLLDARLRLLVDRGVPVRALRPAPGGRAIRVVFGDGTVLLSRGTGQGDFGRLALALLTQSVRLGGYSRAEGRTTLEFRWNPDHRLAAVAVGLDQPD
ncbi:hypothetical protein [Lapillicoccus sp.]|uniref:hypothetical protein n=1 Tax=Lapillicoccus sp. TaxID=1909287 RepID=UPI003264FB1F